MKSFVAIDFETANKERTSVCSVGMVFVKDDEIVDRFYSLIRPVPNYYHFFTTRVHGLRRRDTDSALLFPQVWHQVRNKVQGLPFVAHNKAFDESCLRALFDYYHMSYPNYRFYCTLSAARAKLNLPNNRLETVASYVGYDLRNHHNALADAEACAKIALEIVDFTDPEILPPDYVAK